MSSEKLARAASDQGLMRTLSKSKLIAFRQCPKRLWLEIHKPTVRKDSESTETSYKIGDQVGEVARRIYDPRQLGETIDAQKDGYGFAFKRTDELLASNQPIFEALFSGAGALAFADVMLPHSNSSWKMIEVKSSTSLKDYHKDDASIQAFVAKASGLKLDAVALAHINRSFVYQGNGRYAGLLKENDLTSLVFSREGEVRNWIAEAHAVANLADEPQRETGPYCSTPFECGFRAYCDRDKPVAEFPIEWLPGSISKKYRQYIEANGPRDMRDVPDDVLTPIQKRVKQHTLSDTLFFDSSGAAAALQDHPLPAYFLDFETIQFAVPIWKGTQPYQQIPFQFSLHILDKAGNPTLKSFLDLSGNDPSRRFAEALVADCGSAGPVFVYNATFEGARLSELSKRFPDLSPALLAIKARLVDLHPITKANYYHPSQKASWSIKEVLPAVDPKLSYEILNGVKDGGQAMAAYLTAIKPETSPEEKAQIERDLIDYCTLDTWAMVRLWEFLSGCSALKL